MWVMWNLPLYAAIFFGGAFCACALILGLTYGQEEEVEEVTTEYEGADYFKKMIEIEAECRKIEEENERLRGECRIKDRILRESAKTLLKVQEGGAANE